MMEDKGLFNEEAEKGALGCMLLDADRVVAHAKNRMLLPVEAFSARRHQIICKVLYDMMEGSGQGIDVVTVSEHLTRIKEMENVGGVMYLNELIDAVPTVGHAEFYLDIVRQKYILRRIEVEAMGVRQDCLREERGDVLLKKIPDRFTGIIDEVVHEESNLDGIKRLYKKWEDAKNKEGESYGLPLPWKEMNKVTGGLETALYILAGRPSQGKTTMEDCIAVHLASKGIPVGRVTLDLTRERLLARAICRKAGVSLPKLKSGFAGASQMEQVWDAGNIIGNYPMYINDTDRELSAICTWARAEKMRHDIQLLTVDFVQLITVSGLKSNWNRNLEVAYITQTFKGLAVELKIPVLLLSQLSRASEHADRPPQLSDLRDSGSLEQDAYMVIMLYKDKDVEETKQRRPVWVDICKHQDGETGSLEFWLRPHYFRFDEAGEGWGSEEIINDEWKRGRKMYWGMGVTGYRSKENECRRDR